MRRVREHVGIGDLFFSSASRTRHRLRLRLQRDRLSRAFIFVGRLLRAFINMGHLLRAFIDAGHLLHAFVAFDACASATRTRRTHRQRAS